MVSVLLIDLVILLTAFPTGFAVLRLLDRVFSCGKKGDADWSFTDICAAGLAAAGVYAGFWSLFGGVELAALLVFAAVSLVSALFFQSGLRLWGRTHVRVLPAVLAVLLLVFSAFLASHGIMHYDSDLYHAQSIRWIETYGAVKGLANLHNRLGYNSAAFVLTALYSFSFTGRSFHAVQGFLYFLLLFEALTGLFGRRQKSSVPYRFLCLAAVYYLASVSDEIVSPASDYFMVLWAFLLLLSFLRIAGSGVDAGETAGRYCVLFIGAVFLVTVKLSAAGLLLLGLFPLVYCIRKRQAGRIFSCFLAGLAAAFPFFARNVILTGYLLYPVPSIDLFSVSWKVPVGAAEYDALEIRAFGRGFTDVASADVPVSSWLPRWFMSQALSNRVFLILCIAGLVPAVCVVIRARKGTLFEKSLACMEAALAGSLLLWLFGSPLFRYGCVFVYSMTAVNAGMVFGFWMKRTEHRSRTGERILLACSCLFVLYKAGAVLKEQAGYAGSGSVQKTVLLQQDYGTYACSTYQIGSQTFWYPTQGDQTGYQAFPSSPSDRSGTTGMYTENLKDGFYSLESDEEEQEETER